MAGTPNVYLLMGSNPVEGEAGYANQKLWLFMKGKTIEEICRFIFLSEMTDRIEFHYGSLRSVYVGFNKVESIIDNGEGTVSVKLSGGSQIEEDAPNEGDLADNGSDGVSGGEGSESGDIPAE